MTIKIHLSNIRPNAFGGMTYGTLCNRFRVSDDGMNLTDKETEVTCFFCLKATQLKQKRAA